ncbi:MAG: substrate-binding domain-containing protein [Candidatus Omnitrophota bacterium]
MVKKESIYAFVIPRFEDIFSSFFATEVIKGVSVTASRIKSDILIHISEKHGSEDWLNSSRFNFDYVDGILIGDIDGDKNILKKLVNKKIPYLIMNNYFADLPINCITIDNYKASIEVVDYLVSLGHTQIATITGDLLTQSGALRLNGFKDALKKHNIKLKDSYVGVGNFLRTPARIVAEKILSLKPRPTAIFAASDVMAMEVIDAAKSKGLDVPNDLSVVGFDDNPINIYSPVPLTTVSQPVVEMGRLALETLHQISLGKIKLPVKILLPTQLIKRKSAAALSKKGN